MHLIKPAEGGGDARRGVSPSSPHPSLGGLGQAVPLSNKVFVCSAGEGGGSLCYNCESCTFSQSSPKCGAQKRLQA